MFILIIFKIKHYPWNLFFSSLVLTCSHNHITNSFNIKSGVENVREWVDMYSSVLNSFIMFYEDDNFKGNSYGTHNVDVEDFN